jgi:hypothetical protein
LVRIFHENTDNVKRTEDCLAVTYLTFNEAKSLEDKPKYMDAATSKLASLFWHKGYNIITTDEVPLLKKKNFYPQSGYFTERKVSITIRED